MAVLCSVTLSNFHITLFSGSYAFFLRSLKTENSTVSVFQLENFLIEFTYTLYEYYVTTDESTFLPSNFLQRIITTWMMQYISNASFHNIDSHQ
jgi:hypothetical protein